jgi:hypothetical protein
MTAIVIAGTAYTRRATLEIAGDTLTWRAQRGLPPVAENIVTTVHAVRLVSWLELRHSWAGVAITALGVLWLASEGVTTGLATIAAGLGVLGWRFTHPRQFLVLDLGQNRLVMKVALSSAASARLLAARIDRALETGEVPASPPMLP